jgi:hypothetical protein
MATYGPSLKVLDTLSNTLMNLSSVIQDLSKLPAAGNVSRGGDGQKVAI